MLSCRTRFARYLWFCAFGVAIWAASAARAPGHSPCPKDIVDMVRFDAIIELNAPLCRTHVVLFARYWVSADSYRVAVVWGEPHAGALNFPIYPPTLNVTSDPNAFAIGHQFLHMYDGRWPRPLGPRGPFRHRFNSYHFSDARFAEQDALDLRIRAGDIQPMKKPSGEERERVFDLSRPAPDDESKRRLARVSVRATGGRLDELKLLDAAGGLLKSIAYEYGEPDNAGGLRRQDVLLPERPITVGFKGKGPIITIGGEKRQYSQLETTHHAGGRKCTVDYQPVELRGRVVSLPRRIVVRTGDERSVLRSVRLYDFTACQASAEQVREEAERFSRFDCREMKCRELLLRYWLKQPGDVNEVDVEMLRRLRTHFAGQSVAGMTAGRRLRHVNVLLQLDWMLGDTAGLERDSREYLALLAQSDLGRMVLFGGQNVIDTTIRWAYFTPADRLLEEWLSVAASRNNVEAILEFADAGLRRGRFWTIVKLMNEVLARRKLGADQRFVAQAYRCKALGGVYEMRARPDYVTKDVSIAQARWIPSRVDAETVRAELKRGVDEAAQRFAGLDRPTRQHRALRAQLRKIHAEIDDARIDNRAVKPEGTTGADE